MKHIEALRDGQVDRQNPGQHIGTFLIQASNSPEYLVSQLTAYLEAAKADLDDQNAMMSLMIKTMTQPVL